MGKTLLALMLAVSLTALGCARRVTGPPPLVKAPAGVAPPVPEETPCTRACEAVQDDCRRARRSSTLLMGPWIVVGVAAVAAGAVLAVLGLAAGGNAGCGGGTCPSIGGGSNTGKRHPFCAEARAICVQRCRG